MPESRQQIQFVETAQDSVCVVQLTDTHLCQVRGGTLLGMDTDHSLQAVLERVRIEQPDMALLLATGDLADGGAQTAYDRLQLYLDGVTANHYWLPGNHDNRAAMLASLQRTERLCKEIRVAHWQILMLDSQLPGEVGGALGAQELALLERALQRAQQQSLHSLVCLHHQPVAVGCDWLDEQMVADAAELFAVLDRYPGVRAVLWGHVHQEIDRLRHGVRLLASPSTCVQFAAGSRSFRADDKPPGYRWLRLHADGGIDTGVSRVWNTHFDVELDSSGYL